MNEPTVSKRRACALVLAAVLAGPWSAAHAADNQCTGDVAGVAADLQDSNVVSLTATGLSLVKQARTAGGTVLADSADVALGQEIYFVLLVDNTTTVTVNDLRLSDLLDESQFTYVDGSLEQTVVPSGSDDATIWAGPWAAWTDDVLGPDDGASSTDTGGPAGRDRVTVGADPAQTNLPVDVPGSSIRAIRFRVTVN